MKVYLIRHGQAVEPRVDSAQPLSEEGRSEIEHVARTLQNMNVTVHSVYHSGKLRAEESAMILADALGGGKVKKHAGLAPNDEPEEALELIKQSDKDLMIVSHLPLLDRLLRVLVNPAEDEELPEFGTATLVALSPGDGGWEITRALGPKMIW